MQIVKEFDYQYFYELYLIDQEYEERIHSYICNSILDESYIIEGAKLDAIKAFVEKVIENIKSAFQKFVAKIKDLFSKDEDYFEKYKNVIETVAPLKANISNYYEYNIDKIKNSKLPKLDLEKMKTYNAEIDFIKAQFPDFVPSNDQKFTDKVKEVFRGGDAKTVNAADLTLMPMKEYIDGYDKLTKIMEKDIAMIDDAGLVVKMKFKLAKNSGASPVKKEKIKNESFSFEDTMNYYFTEDGEAPTGGSPKIETLPSTNTNNTTSVTTNKATTNNSSNKSAKDSENQSNMNSADDNEKNMAKQIAEDERKQREEEAKIEAENEKATKMYFNVCSQFLGMRFAMAQEAYSTYSKIIKWHVDQWVKDHDGDRSGKVKKEKAPNPNKVTKDTVFYYKDENGQWKEVKAESDKEAKAMAKPDYEYKADDGKTYKLTREKPEEPQDNKSQEEEDKDKFKTKPYTIYFIDKDGYMAMKPDGKPIIKRSTTQQKYSDFFKPGQEYTFPEYNDNTRYHASLKKGKIKAKEEEAKQKEQQKQNSNENNGKYPKYYFKDRRGKIYTLTPPDDTTNAKWSKPGATYVYNGIVYPLTTDKSSLEKK